MRLWTRLSFGGGSGTPVPRATVAAIVPATGPEAGGTHVVIEVDDSTGATSAHVAGVALTGFGIDDGAHVSGDTVAHAVGTADVTVTNAGGVSDPLVAGFEYELALPIGDPADSLLTLWLRAEDYDAAAGGGNDEGYWPSTASAGSSGGAAAFTQPTAAKVPALDGGIGGASIDSNDVLKSTDLIATILSTAAWFVAGVGSLDAVAAFNSGAPYLNAAFATNDTQGMFYLTGHDSGMSAGHFEGTGFTFPKATVDFAADTADHWFMAWYDGTDIHLVVDGEEDIAAGVPHAFSGFGGTVMILGRNYNDTTSIEGGLREFMASNTALADQDERDGIAGYLIDKFGL